MVKWLMPAIYFGLVALVLVYFVNRVTGHWTSVAVLLAPTFFGVLGYSIMRNYNFRLVDEVWLDEHEIAVCNGSQEDRFPLHNLSHIEVTSRGKGRHITLFLKEPSVFGDEIMFLQSIDRSPPVEKLLDEAYRQSQLEETK